MKYAEITPIHKKEDKTNKQNYHSIRILPNLSKVYERLLIIKSIRYERLLIIRSIHIFIQYFLNFSVGFGKVLMHSIVF